MEDKYRDLLRLIYHIIKSKNVYIGTRFTQLILMACKLISLTYIFCKRMDFTPSNIHVQSSFNLSLLKKYIGKSLLNTKIDP